MIYNDVILKICSKKYGWYKYVGLFRRWSVNKMVETKIEYKDKYEDL